MSRSLLLALPALALVVGGCGGDRSTPTTADSPAAPASSAPSSSASTQPPSTAAPAAGPTHTRRAKQARPRRGAVPQPRVSGGRRPARASGVSTPESHLLTELTVPRLGRGSWTIRTTSPESGSPVGVCQKTLLVDLGALVAVRRVFTGHDDSGQRARQVVGRFADPKSAWRAHQVLTAWRDDCAERVDRPRTRVADLQSVELAAAVGDHYAASYGESGSRTATGLAIVRQGRWLTVLELRAPATSWPTGRDPERQSVTRIAETF